MKPENRFKHRLVIPALNTLDNCWFFINESSLSIRGLPDIIGVVNGRFFAWEVKKSLKDAQETTGRIVLQRYVLNLIEKAGGIARIVYPENLEECLDELRQI